MIPSRIREAIGDARLHRGALPQSRPSGEPDEIAIAVAPRSSLRRVVAVSTKDVASETVQVLLVASEVEQATDLDLIVESDSDGLPFSFMVQGELYGHMFTDQLVAAIGTLRSEETDAVATALETDGESLDGYHVGPPLAGPDDVRRSFKDAEHKELEEFVSACRDWMLGAPAERQVPDPEVLLPPPAGSSLEEAESRYLELLMVLAERPGSPVLPSELLVAMGHAHLLDELRRWRTDFGLDVARVLAQIHIPDEIRGSGPLEAPVLSAVGDEERSVVVLHEYLACEAQAGTMTIDIRSTTNRWAGRGRLVLVQHSTGRVCRGRAVLQEAA